jgi:hypothetical protein
VATLKRLEDGATFPIPAACIVGRSPSCGLRVDGRYASSEHAKFVWTGSRWALRDLGSRNGTFVDGRHLEPGLPEHLSTGAQLGFGDKQGWLLLDDAAPGALATDLESREVVAAEGELLVLPSPERPELSVYPAASGGGWVAEDADGDARPVDDQAVVTTAGRSYRLDLPVISEATPMIDVAMTLQTVDLDFAVSRDEERVELTVLLHGIRHPLEPREHGYLLLTLARARREDAALAPEERGWRTIDQLHRMLRLEPNAINVAIHRARQQLGALGMEGAAGIVEVRRGARRIGTDRFDLRTLDD